MWCMVLFPLISLSQQRNDAVVSVRRVATGNGKSFSAHESPGQDQGFEVNLVHAGRTVRQLVHEAMMVGQLAVLAAAIFGLDPRTVVLLAAVWDEPPHYGQDALSPRTSEGGAQCHRDGFCGARAQSRGKDAQSQ